MSVRSFHPGFGAVFGARHPDPTTVLDASVRGVRRTDLDEHLLLELGEPLVGAGFLSATFVFETISGKSLAMPLSMAAF
jgi:hypothetical protein